MNASFSLCVLLNILIFFNRDSPPSKEDIKVLQKRIAAPLTFCHIAQGRASFFSFSSIDLPVLS